MTSNHSDHAMPSQSSLERFASHLSTSVPRNSRRDFMRVAAIMSSSAAMTGAIAPIEAFARQGSGHSQPQGDVETGVEVIIPFNPLGQELLIDPHRAPNWGPFWVLLPHVWAGLLAFDENGAVVPDLAESVMPNATADVWTARIKPNLTFASGNPINAQIFVDSWLRALDPLHPAPMASFMELVSGYRDYVSGQSKDIGFKVVDDLTIEITLSSPYSSFPASLATFVWAAVDIAVMDDPGIERPLLAGPGAGIWQFTEIGNGQQLVMEPNPHSVAKPSPSIAKVVWQIIEGPEAEAAALELYRDGSVVSADIPSSLLPPVTDDENLTSELVTIADQASTMVIGMDFNQPPFNDARVRRSVAMAIDRAQWSNQIWAEEFVPAVGLVPPIVAATSGYDGAEPSAFDPEQSRALLAESGLGETESDVDIVYYQPISDSPAAIERHAALLAMIEENSGLAIRHDVTLTAEQIVALQGDNGGRQFDIVWWWTVTDTAALLGTVARSDSPYMAGWFNWSPDIEPANGDDPGAASAKFDELLTIADGSVDATARNDAFREAEQLLLDNAVCIPLGHWVQRYVQKPWLKGTRQGPWSGRIPVRFDESVIIQGREQT